MDSTKIDTIRKQLQECIMENFPRAQEEELQVGEDLYEKGIIDSLGFLTMISFMEETFEMDVADEDVIPENFVSIEAMATYVGNKLNGTSV